MSTTKSTLSLENSPLGLYLVSTNSLAAFQGDMLPTFTGTTMWVAWELTCHLNYVRDKKKPFLPPATPTLYMAFSSNKKML